MGRRARTHSLVSSLELLLSPPCSASVVVSSDLHQPRSWISGSESEADAAAGDLDLRLREASASLKSKTQKGSNEEERVDILWAISGRTDHLRNLISICEECTDDPVTVENVFCVLRQCILAKSPWRSKNIERLIELGAAEGIFSSLTKQSVRPHSSPPQQQEAVSDQGTVCAFWILSALSSKDAKFGLRVRLCGALPLLAPLLRQHSSKALGLYPLLQVIKALARDEEISTVMGDDGLTSSVADIVRQLVATRRYSIKLKVALETLHLLVKANRMGPSEELTSCDFLSILMDVFGRFHPATKKLECKVTASALSLLLDITSCETGRHNFVEQEGIMTLAKFCFCFKPADIKWSSLLNRASVVLGRCCPATPLPIVGKECPLRFDLGRDVSQELPCSSGTSRETTPESETEEDEDNLDSEGGDEGDDADDEEEEEDNDVDRDDEDVNGVGEEEDGFCFGEEGVISPDDDELSLAEGSSDLRHSRSSGNLNLQHLCREYFVNQNDVNDSTNTDLSVSEKPTYLSCSVTQGINRFVKVAYPDMVSAKSPECFQEPLVEKDLSVYRKRIQKSIRHLLGDGQQHLHKTVFSLDSLLSNESDLGPAKPIGNRDIQTTVAANNTSEANSNEDDDSLRFESRFESGNLRKAIRIGDREYDLVLTPDVNASKNHQWFYFEVSNMTTERPYTFNIINSEKSNSQFNFGMQPLMFSVKEATKHGRPYWTRTGSDVVYYRNHYSKPSSSASSSSSSGCAESYLTASFVIQFLHDNDVCYLAYHFPYTYTQLMLHLRTLRCQVRLDTLFREDRLSSTEQHGQRRPVPLVTITSRVDNSNALPVRDRKVVVLTARVHPGETNSSWIMKGVLDFLTSGDRVAIELRAKFVFKIIPMLNVEGVINGCHRFGLTGEDLNRRWLHPNPVLHPSVFHAKELIAYVSRHLKQRPFLFCDFHGHSRKKNVFLYGCSSARSWLQSDRKRKDDANALQLLEASLELNEPCFDRRSCRYTVEKGRESTARVVLWREFKVQHSFTMESTFCGFNKRTLKGTQMSTHHLTGIGKSFLISLLSFYKQSLQNS